MKHSCATLLLQNLDVIYKKHKQVAIKIESYWGTELCDRYLRYLLVKECVTNPDEERKDRLGFEYDVYVVLLTLYVMHIKLYTNFNAPLLLQNPNITECDMTDGPTVEEAVELSKHITH